MVGSISAAASRRNAISRRWPPATSISRPKPGKFSTLSTNQVNAAITPVSNYDHWGTTLDHWDYPLDGKGDCKVYALEKRRELMLKGFPRQALLMTVVLDLNGEGHAILTVKTNRGEFILDNLTNAIRPWNATGYQFLKRQAQEDPNVWVSIGDPKAIHAAIR